MITLKEIAEEAGVTPMTVSNVINQNYARVSPATIERIQAIIEKHNYVPNMAAKSLHSKKSNIISLLIPLWDRTMENVMHDPYVSRLVGYLQAMLRKNQYFIMVWSFERAEQVVRMQRSWRVDGSILVLPHHDRVTRELVKTTQVPMVVFDRHFDNIDSLSVMLEDRKGGYLATRYLLEKGHRKIGFITPTLDNSMVTKERYNGYRDALAEFGVSEDERWIYTGYYHMEGGMALGEKLAHDSERPTALVVTEDLIACALMKSFQKSGGKVPEDLSVVGFDDITLDELVTPTLTTVSQNLERKASEGVRLLMSAIQDKQLKNEVHRLDVRLIERESVQTI